MESKKIHIFMKKYGVLLFSSILIVAIILTVSLLGTKKSANYELEVNKQPWADVEVETKNDTFLIPLQNCTVLKDYNATIPMYNATLGEYSAHKWVDLASQTTKDVCSVLDGTVLSVENTYGLGNIVTISHGGEIVTVYASLDDVVVKEGDDVKRGDLLGKASSTAKNELHLGDHLHFEVLQNDKRTDPNLYLDLAEK